MKLALRNSAVVAGALLLASCTAPTIEIAVSRVDGRQVVSLSQDWGLIFSRKKAPCVDRIELHADEAGTNGAAWRLESETAECVDLSGFIISQVPSGFVETVPLPPEARGTFRLLVTGIGFGEEQVTLP